MTHGHDTKLCDDVSGLVNGVFCRISAPDSVEFGTDLSLIAEMTPNMLHLALCSIIVHACEFSLTINNQTTWLQQPSGLLLLQMKANKSISC